MKIGVRDRLRELLKGDLYSTLMFLSSGDKVIVEEDCIKTESGRNAFIESSEIIISKMLIPKTSEYFALHIIITLYFEALLKLSRVKFYNRFNTTELVELYDYDARESVNCLFYYDEDGDIIQVNALDFLLKYSRLSGPKVIKYL